MMLSEKRSRKNRLIWWITLISIQVLNQFAFLVMIQFVPGSMDTWMQFAHLLLRIFVAIFILMMPLSGFDIGLIGLIGWVGKWFLCSVCWVCSGVVLFLLYCLLEFTSEGFWTWCFFLERSVFLLFKWHIQFLKLVYGCSDFLFFSWVWYLKEFAHFV